MTPYLLAKALYGGDAKALDNEILLWSKDPGGIVVSTAEFLMLVSTPPSKDVFHVYLLAGEAKPAAEHLAQMLPWRSHFSYMRRGEVRVGSTVRWLRKLGLDDNIPLK